ncbi:surface layer protein NpdA [Paracidovorax avenae]|uniref:surface layer protein NpdA n=1 Tax=Paracidovorax avenae TaxID=80867 RepID=UPI000D2008C5|nr:surface layer protein NpdA [Paracidovorax avenae]AVT12594.1 surface layer protein NpdA [Paracidovorax avenae]
MKRIHPISRAAAALLGTLAVAGAAHAGVIAGTGATPSGAQLGYTNAAATRVVEGKTGHALLVPYFTAQNGQMSVLHLVNMDRDNGKVVNVRFRGANNGDRLLSMHVLLGPGDIWTGAVTAGADGTAQLTTDDTTCTLPQLSRNVPQPFSTDRLDPAWSAATKAAQTREGSIEAIVMADVPGARAYGDDGASNSTLFTLIKAVNGVQPCTERYGTLNTLLLDDISGEPAAASRGLATPTGQVAATWYIIDVPGSTTFAGAATAVQAIDIAGQPARGNYMLFPPTDGVVGQPELYTADPLLVSAGQAYRYKDAQGSTAQPTAAPVLAARFNDLPDLSTPMYLPASAENARRTAGDLSRLMATREVRNQYVLDQSISALTDWVLATPTKRYSVAKDYSQSDTASQRVYSVVPPAGSGTQYFHAANTQVGQSVCSLSRSWGMLTFSRQSMMADHSVPPTNVQYESCGAVSVLSFGQKSALASSINQQYIFGDFTSGWASILVPDAQGLPIIGTSVMKLSNPNATPGIAANYGMSYPHLFKTP